MDGPDFRLSGAVGGDEEKGVENSNATLRLIPLMKAVVKFMVLLAVVAVALGCAVLAYLEYRFAQYTNDLRVMWWSLVVGLLFVTAVVGGVVGAYHLVVSIFRKGLLSEWEQITSKALACVCALGVAALFCCYLAINQNPGVRQSQLGVIDPGKVVGYWVDRQGRTVGVAREGDSSSTGMLAYWFPGLTGALSAAFTWFVGVSIKRPS